MLNTWWGSRKILFPQAFTYNLWHSFRGTVCYKFCNTAICRMGSSAYFQQPDYLCEKPSTETTTHGFPAAVLTNHHTSKKVEILEQNINTKQFWYTCQVCCQCLLKWNEFTWNITSEEEWKVQHIITIKGRTLKLWYVKLPPWLAPTAYCN